MPVRRTSKGKKWNQMFRKKCILRKQPDTLTQMHEQMALMINFQSPIMYLCHLKEKKIPLKWLNPEWVQSCILFFTLSLYYLLCLLYESESMSVWMLSCDYVTVCLMSMCECVYVCVYLFVSLYKYVWFVFSCVSFPKITLLCLYWNI